MHNRILSRQDSIVKNIELMPVKVDKGYNFGRRRLVTIELVSAKAGKGYDI